MKTLLSILCLVLLIALIGEHEHATAVEQQRDASRESSRELARLANKLHADLRQEVNSCDDYVAKHEKVMYCPKGLEAWSEGGWTCIIRGKQASK